MLSRFLCCFCVFSSCFLPLSAWAADFGSANYEVYRGHLDGDSSVDIYLRGKNRFVLLHGKVAIPIWAKPHTSYLVPSKAVGDEDWDDNGIYETFDSVLQSPRVSEHYTDEQIVNEGLTKLVENKDYYWGDFDGDGSVDLVLRVDHSDWSRNLHLGDIQKTQRLFFISGGANQSAHPISAEARLGAQTPGRGLDFVNRQFIVKDVDGDGRHELTINPGGGYAENYYNFSVNSGGTLSIHRSYQDEQPPQAPTLVGASDGQFRVDEVGAATYSIPLNFPKGPGGITPVLSLNYSSQGGNGIAGQGWSLGGLGAVSRCRQTVAQDTVAKAITWSEEDRFCLNGQRLVVVEGRYGEPGSKYQTEVNSYVYVTAFGGSTGHPDYFTVEAKDGSVTYYGDLPNAKQKNANGQTNSWAQNRFVDSVGNSINFEYTQNHGSDFFIRRIAYAYAGSPDPKVQVSFEYEDKLQSRTYYVAGHRFSNSKRLKRIIVRNTEPDSVDASSLTEIRRYNLYYRTPSEDSVDKRSFVSSIQECVGAQCLPATRFSWSINRGRDFGTKTFSKQLMVGKDQLGPLVPMDINGDGYRDIAWLEENERYQKFNYLMRYALFNPATQQFDDGEFINHDDSEYLWLNGDPRFGKSQGRIVPIDYNADGRQDIALYQGVQDSWRVYLSTPSNDGSWNIDSTEDGGNGGILLPAGGRDAVFVDVDSDGMADMLTPNSVYYLRKSSNNSSSSTLYGYAASKPVAIVTSNGGELNDFSSYQTTPTDVYYKYKKVIPAGDLNGDGRADVIVASRLLAGKPSDYYDYGTVEPKYIHENYYAAIQEDAPTGGGIRFRIIASIGDIQETDFNDVFNSNDLHGSGQALAQVFAPDLNGDGLTDIIFGSTNERPDGTTSLTYILHLNTGDGFAPQVPVRFFPNDKDVSAQTTDVDGDGHIDFFWHKLGGYWSTHYMPWVSSTNSFGDVVSAQIYSDGKQGERHFFYDINGDGSVDLLHYSDHNLSLYPNRVSGFDGVVNAITNGLGATTRITYERLNNSEHYSGIELGANKPSRQFSWQDKTMAWDVMSYPDVDAFYSAINSGFTGVATESQSFASIYRAPVFEYVTALPIVTRIESDAPSGAGQATTAAIEYLYEQAKFQAAGRGFLGFKSLTTLDWQSGVRVQTQYRQDWPFVGSPVETSSYLHGDVMNRSTSRWAFVDWDSAWIGDVAESGSVTHAPYTIYPDTNVDTTYAFKTVSDNITQIEPKLPAVVHCKIGGTCPTNPGKNADVELQTITTTQKFDRYGNPYEISVKTQSDGVDMLKTTRHDYDIDYDPATLGTNGTIAFADGRSLSYRALGRLSTTKVLTTLAGEESNERWSVFTYNESGVHAGLLKLEVIEPVAGNAHTLYRHHSHDSFGNVNEIRVVASEDIYNAAGDIIDKHDIERITKTYYDDLGRYVKYTEDALGHKSGEVIERNAYGAPTKITYDDKDLISTINYDVLGREIRTSDNTGAWASTEYLSCAQAYPICPSGAIQAVRSRVAGGGQSIQYFDKLARVVREGQVTFDGSWAMVTTEYDVFGRVHRISEPHASAANPTYWTENTYDVIGRPVRSVAPDNGVTETHYDGHNLSIKNALNQWRYETRNSLGQLVRVEDHLGSSLDYGYSVEGYLERIVPNNDIARTTILSYDILGRKIAMNDPDKGNWEYRYNAMGEMVWQKDGKGQVVLLSYDDLGRNLRRTDYDSSGQVEQHARWYYDSVNDAGEAVSHAQGQLTAVVMSTDTAHERCSDSSVQQCTRYHYDELGRSYQTDQIIRENYQYADAANDPLHTYTTRVEFDSVGRAYRTEDALSGLVLDASDRAVTTGTESNYNAFGYLDRIVDLHTGTVLQDIRETNLRGQVTEMLVGPLTRTNFYDDTLGRLTTQEATVGGQAFKVQEQHYTWDTLSNLSSRSNKSHRRLANGSSTPRNLEESFCYDGLNRLIKTNSDTTSTAACASLTEDKQDLRYSRLGNIAYKANVGTYTYAQTGNAGPSAVTGTSDGMAYDYDANGNMVVSSGGGQAQRTVHYTTFDKPYFIERGEHRIEFKYGVDRARYWRQSSKEGTSKTKTTIYLGNVEKIISSTTLQGNRSVEWKRYVPGGVITYYTLEEGDSYGLMGDAEVSHILKDHLGSVDVIVDVDGTVLQSMSFDPWGERRNDVDWSLLTLTEQVSFNRQITNRGYTDHEMLDEVGLVHMNGRIYDARLARFMQADPFIQEAKNTQNYNRYSYLLNNPLNATDPSGYLHSYVVNKALRQAIGITAAIVATAICQGPCGAHIYAAIAAASAAINGADGEGILIAAVSAAFTAAVGGANWGSDWGRAFAVATASGITSVLQGGKFGHGFVSSQLSSLAGSFMPTGNSPWKVAARISVGAVVGGTASEISGGKFANGAATGAFTVAVQEWAKQNPEAFSDTDDGLNEDINNAIRGMELLERFKIEHKIVIVQDEPLEQNENAMTFEEGVEYLEEQRIDAENKIIETYMEKLAVDNEALNNHANEELNFKLKNRSLNRLVNRAAKEFRVGERVLNTLKDWQGVDDGVRNHPWLLDKIEHNNAKHAKRLDAWKRRHGKE